MNSRNVLACLLGSAATGALLLGAGAASAQAQSSNSIETVTVTASRKDATEVKHDAPNVVEVRPVTEIQKLPDVNLAEALQRVPGVALETDTGEGRFVNIRGMDADLNGTTYDGVRLTASNPSSPQGGGRAVAFDAFPSGIMGGVEVIKSLTPDIDAEGLGGIVNLIPRTMPQDSSELLELSVGTGVESLRGSPVWDGEITGGVRFGPNDDMSFIVSYDYHSDWRGIDDLEEDYLNEPPDKTFDDAQFRWYKYHRIRQGIGAGYTWDVDSHTSLFVRGFYSGYTEFAMKHEFILKNLGDDGAGGEPVLSADGTYMVPDANANQKFVYSKENVANKLIEGGGHTNFDDGVLLDYRASWTEGTDVVPFSYSVNFSDPNNVAVQYNNRNASTPSYSTTDGTDLTNPSNYPFDSGDDGPSHNSDTEAGGATNLTIPLAFDDNGGDLKFGGAIRARVRRAIASDASLDDSASVLSDFTAKNDQVYYADHYNIGPMADLHDLVALPIGPQIVDPSTYEHDNENIYAGYGQYTGTSGKLSYLAGVRVESTNAIYRANAVDDNDVIIGPTANKQDYTNFFPDVDVKYQFNDQFQVRAAFTTSIARPGFNQITAARSVDVPDLIISEGNPTLKPTTAKNYDLTAEYYLPNGGLATGGLFYKQFANYIIPTTQNVPGSQFPTYFAPGDIVELDSFANIGSASVKGIELQYVQQFLFLPQPLDGLGFDGNFTYVQSRGDIRPGEEHGLPQTSPLTYNAAIFYEKGPVELRLAASFVSHNLWAVGGDAGSDLYSQPRFRLDFGGSYAITDDIDYYVDVKNITNTKLEFTQTPSKEFPVQRELYKPDYLTGIRIRFE